jgi:AP endonuclease-2
MRFYTALQRRWEALIAAGRAVIVVGDMNIAPGPLDYPDYDPEYYRSSRPDRLWLRDLLSSSSNSSSSSSSGGGDGNGSNNRGVHIEGAVVVPPLSANHCTFTDCFRVFHPERLNAFTVWSTATGARSNNYGSRIDLTLSAGLHVGNEAPQLQILHSTQKLLAQEQQQHEQQQEQQRQVTIVNDEVYVSAADIEPIVHGSDHCPVWLELKINPNSNRNNNKKSPVKFPCSLIAPPCAMRFYGKQTKLHTWLAMGRKDTTDKEGTDRGEEEEVVEDLDVAAAAAVPQQQPPPAGGGTGSGSSRPKQMSLKSFVKVSSTAAAAPISSAPLNTLSEQPTTTTTTNNSTFLQAELQAAAKLEEKHLTTAKNAWQAIQKRMQAPTCLHGDPAALKKVNKTGPNQGRYFYMCARGKGQGPNAQCSFFKWVEKKPGDAPRTTMMTEGSGSGGPSKRAKQ